MDRRTFEHLLTNQTSRRRFLGAALAVTTSAVSFRGAPTRAAGGQTGQMVVGRPQFAAYPFALGVASGDPTPDGIVLWTRLAPDPLNGGGMAPEPVEVRWEVAEDESFKEMLQAGTVTATPDLAHSVHVDVAGLEPGRDYAYRFMAGDEVSQSGRTRTAPATNAPLDRLRFASVSCAHWEHGYFSAYRHLAAEEVDFAICLGDYIYEYAAEGGNGSDGGPVRLHTGGETVTLADYRTRHALYKTDPDLQAAHLAMPWIVTWDDHEVENDYAGVVSETNEPAEAFLARRAAAYQAYYEHMPLRPESMPHGPDAQIYRRLTFGDLAEFNMLDTRQYRTDQQCGGVGPRCDASLDPAMTLTGPEQETWLFEGLAESNTRWNVIAQQVMMAQLDAAISPFEQLFNQDQWDGYPLARQRLLDHLISANVSNPVVLTGDVHSAWVADIKLDFDDPSSPVVGTELVTTSVTSHNPIGTRLRFLLVNNPHFAFYDDAHGYTRHEITPDLWKADYLALNSVETLDSRVETLASFVIENGQAGAERS